jgi:hypothetical protein
MLKKRLQVGNYKYGEPCVEWFNKKKPSNKLSTLYSTHGP